MSDPGKATGDLLSPLSTGGWSANLSVSARRYLAGLGIDRVDSDPAEAALLWLHALATSYSPAYLAENATGIRQGWPRIPLPSSEDLLRASAAFGEQIAALLDTHRPVPGVTAGTIAPALAVMAVPSTRAGATRDWRLTAWGNQTKTGVMPGRGHSSPRDYNATESATAAEAALLGTRTFNIGMNGASFWKNIPEAVWETHIGGYQVLKKWLSYRDASILNRPLSEAEVQHVTDTARRLAALRLLGPALDAIHHACAAAHTPLPAPA